MNSRRHVFLLLVAFALFAHAHDVIAQCPYPQIQNFNSPYSPNRQQMALTWDAPPGVPAGTKYEILQDSASNYCLLTRNFTVIATTTATSYTAATTTSNLMYAFQVQVQSQPCTKAYVTWLHDTFTSPPAKPPIPTVVTGAAGVTVTFAYSDYRTVAVDVERAGTDGKFTWVGSSGTCGRTTHSVTDKNVPSGTYQYRLRVFNGAGTQSSDPVTVTVGTTTAPEASFSATPLKIRAGQSATLSWITKGATSVVIDNGVGSQPLSGSVTVTPPSTTTYTLTASSGSLTTKASATITVITDPVVVLRSAPSAMLQNQDQGGATTRYTLSNAGGATTAINLSQSGTFFTQSPASFTLAPGGSQVVTLTALPRPAGAYEGASLPSGAGVEAGFSIRVKLLSTAPPTGTVSAKPATNRVDVSGAAGASPSGTINFTNSGNGTLTGIVASDVPWIVPQSGPVSIPPGGTVPVSFTIDRSQRPDASALLGSATGNISLVYARGGAGTLDITPAPAISIVTVSDTVQLSVSSGTAPPALNPGEVALFIPGAGHVAGTVGTFVSDISMLNPLSGGAINDIRFFFTPMGAGAVPASTTLPPIATSISLSDVVKTVFSGEGQLGTLQIRSASASKLSVNTNIFNTSNPAGTYGTTIPTFRSDRAVGAGGRLVLTGLRQDATGHTNLFIQETSGVGVTVQTEFLDASGSTLSSRSETAGPFALSRGTVPAGAVAAILTNQSTGSATFLAYATPVDDASGDNWSVVDWSRQYGYSGTDSVIVPVAGVLQGANNTFFRTDVAITNTGSSSGTGTLRFYPRGGTPIDRQITLGGRQTNVLRNVIGDLFGAPNGTVGYLRFTPSAGSFALTSRTYTTLAGSVATFGTHVPAILPADSLTVGGLRTIGSLQDAAVSTIVAARPATFRTNFALVETSGKSATVRVTLRYSYSAGVKLQAYSAASKDYVLSPNEFRQLSGIAGEIIGSERETLGDLRELEADFQVISGDGAIAIYTSSTDNGTGDVILRTQ